MVKNILLGSLLGSLVVIGLEIIGVAVTPITAFLIGFVVTYTVGSK